MIYKGYADCKTEKSKLSDICLYSFEQVLLIIVSYKARGTQELGLTHNFFKNVSIFTISSFFPKSSQ